MTSNPAEQTLPDPIGPGNTLLSRAVEHLRTGPAHTLELAGLIGLSGHTGAASAAVFTLLGSDSRFQVDPQGTWTLVDREAEIGTPIHDMRYSVVDVETTGGGYLRGHRITEVAIVEVVGGRVNDEFSTLVNPGRHIPSMISSLTGITSQMVKDSPTFHDIAEEVLERLTGRVFVAHNARFDWGFVQHQLLDSLGVTPDLAQLCTVRMTRRLVPELTRRNLDSVTQYFGIDIQGRHRAGGDALATAQVLLRLLDQAEAQGIYDFPGLEAFLAAGRGRKGRISKRTQGAPK